MSVVQVISPALVSGAFAVLVAVVTSRLTVSSERRKFERDLAKERDAWSREFSAKYAEVASENNALAERIRQQFAHAFLYVRNPETNVSDRRFIPSGANMVVGSDSGCDIELPATSGTVSRRHAMIQFVGDHFELSDLSSAGGTFVNGVQIRRSKKLMDGDQLKFGNCEAQFIMLVRPSS